MKVYQYPYHQSYINNLNLKLFYHGILHADSEWSFNHADPSNRLYLIRSGEGIATDEKGNTTILKSSNAYILPKNIAFKLSCSNVLIKTFFHFTLSYQAGLEIFDKQENIMSINISKEIIDEFDKALTSSNINNSIFIESLLLKLIGKFIKTYNLCPEITSKKTLEVKEYIKNNLKFNLSIDSIANNLHVSKSSLSSNFKKETEQTIKRYLHTQLLEEIKKSLIYTDTKIKEISYEFGFKDPFYFSYFFKKHESLSPQAYRKQNMLLKTNIKKVFDGKFLLDRINSRD